MKLEAFVSRIAVAACAYLLALACTDGNFTGGTGKRSAGGDKPATDAPPTNDHVTVPVGETREPQLGEHGQVVSATPKDPAIATWNADKGLINGVSVGTTTVHVKYQDGTEGDLTVDVTPNPNQSADQTGKKPGEPATTTDDSSAPGGLTVEGGESVASPDLAACAALPAKGKTGYGPGTKCPANSVVVIINDGKAQEMTCCPLKGTKILSDKPEDQYQARVGNCQDGEVVTGMTAADGPGLYCSKLNTRLKLDAKQTAVYAKSTDLTPEYAAIADDYNIHDTCICTNGTVYTGGHTTQDNVCVDQCAKIVLKK